MQRHHNHNVHSSSLGGFVCGGRRLPFGDIELMELGSHLRHQLHNVLNRHVLHRSERLARNFAKQDLHLVQIGSQLSYRRRYSVRVRHEDSWGFDNGSMVLQQSTIFY